MEADNNIPVHETAWEQWSLGLKYADWYGQQLFIYGMPLFVKNPPAFLSLLEASWLFSLVSNGVNLTRTMFGIHNPLATTMLGVISDNHTVLYSIFEDEWNRLPYPELKSRGFVKGHRQVRRTASSSRKKIGWSAPRDVSNAPQLPRYHVSDEVLNQKEPQVRFSYSVYNADRRWTDHVFLQVLSWNPALTGLVITRYLPALHYLFQEYGGYVDARVTGRKPTPSEIATGIITFSANAEVYDTAADLFQDNPNMNPDFIKGMRLWADLHHREVEIAKRL